MNIGIDFDNTIVCYDSVFSRMADALGGPPSNDASPKDRLRGYYLSRDQGNLKWTQAQGVAYGSEIEHASCQPSLLENLEALSSAGHTLFVVSHKSRYSVVSSDTYDLRRAARQWLNSSGIVGAGAVIPSENVYFEPTEEAKLARIRSLGCHYFIDDLERLLTAQGFPKNCIPIHFLPEGAPSEPTIRRVQSWSEVADIVDSPHHDRQSEVSLQEVSTRERIELHCGNCGISTESIVPLSGGFNSDLYILGSIDEEQFIAKVYKGPIERWRPRQEREESFYRLIEAAGESQAPKLHSSDSAKGVTIMSKVAGVQNNQLNDKEWLQFLGFLKRIQNTSKHETPLSAEAAISVKASFGYLHQRRDVWKGMADDGQLDPETEDLITGPLENAFQICANRALTYSGFQKKLALSELIVSPSDFGLHNALVGPARDLVFLDFEYAGLDDPCKCIADFFCQPRYPAPISLYPHFLDNFLPNISDAELMRLSITESLIQLKWCYIILQKNYDQSSKKLALGVLDTILNYSETVGELNPILKRASRTPSA